MKVLRKQKRSCRKINIRRPSTSLLFIRHWTRSANQKDESEEDEEEEPEKKLIFLQYRGKATENFERALRRINALCKIITTIKKIKTVLPSLKAPVEKAMKSGLVYQISCSRCQSCYVGKTTRHLLTRIKEHRRIGIPVKSLQRMWGNADNGWCESNCHLDQISIQFSDTWIIIY